ncbi:MAG: transglutaminase family protein [Hespellia sp.]|nr:transglutaminase family protein [Hespellia sp.]
MKKLHFLYRTTFRFDDPVYNHSFALRCIPPNNNVQKIWIEKRHIRPADSIDEMMDGFGNHRYIGHIGGYHDSFEYEVSGIAWVNGMQVVKEKLNPIYKYPSKYTRYEENLIKYYKQIKPQQGDSMQRGIELMHAIYRNFVYEGGVTDVETTAAQALALGKGVCQDYAHILIALCRLNNIPARYVVGLMIGEGFTHAWVEIFVGDGWYGLDPTNDLLVNDYYIKIAHGRDYEDCIVDKGLFYGQTVQHQEVYVNVCEAE